jgi:hypothetical protein
MAEFSTLFNRVNPVFCFSKEPNPVLHRPKYIMKNTLIDFTWVLWMLKSLQVSFPDPTFYSSHAMQSAGHMLIAS